MGLTGRGRAMKRILSEQVSDKLAEKAAIHASVYEDSGCWPESMQKEMRAHIDRKSKAQIARESWMAGAREALEETLHKELIQENYDLHYRLQRLVSLYGVEPCQKCNCEGFNIETSTDCEACSGNGWIPKKDMK